MAVGTITIITTVAAKLLSLYKAHQRGEITKAELDAEVQKAQIEGATEVDKAQYAALEDTYESFMEAARRSRIIAIGWAVTLFTQLAVLLWHQAGIPLYTWYSGNSYPSSGTTVEWAYLLVAGLLGVGPLVLRASPGLGQLKRKLRL